MTYNLTANLTKTGEQAIGQNWGQTGTIRMDIVGFDGENYTINEATMTRSSGLGVIFTSNRTSSETFRMNETGYLTSVNDSAAMQELFSLLGIYEQVFEKNETRAGETWQIPLGTLNENLSGGNSNSVVSGNITETFSDIQNFTVPAGTFRVFRVDYSSTN